MVWHGKRLLYVMHHCYRPVSRINRMMAAREWWDAALERTIPPRLLLDPESARHARLITCFGWLGSIFGLVYALFYLLIGHYGGAGIVAVCTLGVVVSPLLMRGHGSTELAGNFFSAILNMGFVALCLVEGGVHGHAIAWLVSVPLCALLLTGTQSAIKWVIIAFLSAALIVGIDFAGVRLPVTYDEKWSPLVSAAGYLGLVVFMFTLGFIFENGRAKAFGKMRVALGQLEEKNVLLIALNKEKNEFLSMAAHDLKNPLTVILGSGQLLQVIDDRTKTPQLADAIVSAADRMRKLITNLLDVNAIEEGRFASNTEKCDFGELVTQCVEHNLPAAMRKEIEIDLMIEEGVSIKADAAAAAQILDNLISNAVKYSPWRRTVFVQLMAEKSEALVRVRDEGPGISAKDQERLFLKFSRLSAIPTGGESSTGLGLAIAKRLAEAMSGTVRCESVLGKGATFTLRLPLWPKAVEAPFSQAAKTGKVKLSIEATERRLARR